MNQPQYPPYKYVALALFVLISIANGLMWTTFMPITEYSCEILQVSHLHIYMVSLTYMILYPFGSFVGNYFNERKSLRYGVNIGAILTLVGGAVRCLSFLGFIPIIVGECICAFAQPFMNNPVAKFVNEWFEPKVRSFLMTVVSCATLLGNSIGCLIPPIFVNEGNKTMASLNYLLISEEGFAILIGIFFFIFYRNSQHSKNDPDFKIFDCRSYKALLTYKYYMIIAISSAFTVGTFGTFNTVIEAILSPFGFTTENVSIVGFILIFGGTAESFLLGWLSDRTKKYKVLYLISVGLLLCIFISFYFILETQLLYLVIIAILLTGPGLVYMTPLAMDYLAQLTPDIGESVSGGIMQILVQIVTIAQTVGCDAIQNRYPNKEGSKYMLIMIVATIMVALVLGVFMKMLRLNKTMPKTPLKSVDAPSVREQYPKKLGFELGNEVSNGSSNTQLPEVKVGVSENN